MPWYNGDCRSLADHAEPDAPFVQKLVEAAESPWLEVRTGRAYTAFADVTPSSAEAVRDAAWAIYEQIMAWKPTIEFDWARPLQAGGQQFRAAGETVADHQANCLELALLFSSCALRARLDPVFIASDAGETDHAFVGIWLAERGPTRFRLCGPDGFIDAGAFPDMLGVGRLNDAEDYWNRVADADLLVVDCSGAALGYPDRHATRGLKFEAAVARAWNVLTSTSSKIHCALDLQQARIKKPYPERPPPDFVGREDDLAAVAEAASATNVVVSGTLGVGKTALARKYMFEYQHDYPDGVFLLNAADHGRALEQLADFGRESLNNTEWDRGRPGSDTPATNIMLASRWAEMMNKSGPRALLIVDDVADASFMAVPIDGFMSLSSLKCRLLVTTRDDSLLKQDHDFKTIPLAPLDDTDAVGMLLGSLPPDRRDEQVAEEVCKRLNNLPLLIRVFNLKLVNNETLSLDDILQEIIKLGLLLATESETPPDYPATITAVLNKLWQQDLAEEDVGPGPREVLKLLSFLPQNESIPFELLALLVDAGDDVRNESERIEWVRHAAAKLIGAGLAEQPEEDAVRIHPVVREFARNKAGQDAGFIERARQAAAHRLRQPAFYRARGEQDLIRLGERLRLLHDSSRQDDGLDQIVRLFDVQLDNLREGYDAFAQLAMQARLYREHELAEALENVRLEREGLWFRLRWHGQHQRGRDPEGAGHSDAVSAVAVWPGAGPKAESGVAVSGAENGEIIHWEFDSLRSAGRLAISGPAISGLCISPDGSTVYASARDGSLRAWTIGEGERQQPRVIGRHGHSANDCAMDPEGRFVVSVSDDGTARVYDRRTGSLLRALKHAERSPVLRCAVACRPDGKAILITGSKNGIVRVWDPRTGDELRERLTIPRMAEGQPVSACALAPDGELAAVATRTETLLWDLRSGDISPLSDCEHHVADCCFSPDGRQLMLVGRSKRVSIYRVEERARECRLDPWYHWLTACAFGAHGRLFYASDDGSVHSRIYDFRTGRNHVDGLVRGRPNWVNVFRAGDDHALSVSTDETIRLWRLSDGTLVDLIIKGHANWVNAFDVSADGRYVMSGTDSGKVTFWLLRESGTRKSLASLSQRVNACAISKDGTMGVDAGEDGTLRQYSLRDDFTQRDHLTNGHKDAVTACAIAADGKHAVSGGDDALVVFWRLEGRGSFERDFKGHEDRITAVVFPQGRSDTVLSSSWDGTVKWWNAQSGQLLNDFREHTDGVTSCATAAGGVAFSVSLDRTLRRWLLAESSSDARMRLGRRLRGLVADPSGDWVMCSDMSGTVYLFDIVPGSRSVSR